MNPKEFAHNTAYSVQLRYIFGLSLSAASQISLKPVSIEHRLKP